MAARGILRALALSALFPLVSAAQMHPAPTADVVTRLRRHHHAGDWWRITTDSTRYEARVSAIDAQGLAGLTTRRSAPPTPERIAWGQIARIDLRKAPSLGRRITWGILGMSAGFIPLANGHANSNQPGYYLLAGATAGAVLGGYVSEENVHEQALYVAPTGSLPAIVPVVAARETARPETASVVLPSGFVLAVPDTAATDTPAATTPASALPAPSPPTDASSAATAPATSPAAASSPAIERACRRISPQNLLRIDGDFGTFHGYASSIGPEGLGGLRVETRYPSVQPPRSLSWDRIDRIEMHGGNAGRGALSGALSLGAAAGLLGALLGAALGSNNSESGSVAAEFGVAAFGVGAGVGLLMGGAIGATISGWHLVYQRP